MYSTRAYVSLVEFTEYVNLQITQIFLSQEDDALVSGEADLSLSLDSSRAPSLPHLTGSRDASLGPPHPDRRGSRYITASSLPLSTLNIVYNSVFRLSLYFDI